MTGRGSVKNILFMVIFFGLLQAAETVLPEGTVAVVNGTAISEEELDKEVGKLLPRAYFHSTLSEEKLTALKAEATESLIEKNLLYQYALSQKLDVSDAEVDAVIGQLEQGYGSKEKFASALKRIGYSRAAFKKAVAKDEVLKKLYKAEIEATYSDAELKAYYDANRYKFKEPEKIRIRLIYVRNDPQDPAGKQKAKQRAEEALDKIEAGAAFADVAAEYSNAMSRIKGGDMGYLHRGRLDAAVEEEAFALDAGEMSGVIEKDVGCYIVKVEDKKVQNQLSFAEVKESLKRDLKKRVEDERKSALLNKLTATAVIIK